MRVRPSPTRQRPVLRTGRGARLVAVSLVLVAACGSTGDDGRDDATDTDQATTSTPGPSDQASGPTTGPGGGESTVETGGPEWTQYGHDLAHSGLNPHETIVTAASAGDLAEQWSLTDVVGVTSTPTVVDGVAYFGDWSGNVRAVDPADGAEIWTSPLGGSVIGSVAVDGDALFASSGVTLYRLDRATGAVEWEAKTNDHPFAMISASPVAADGLVFQGVASGEVTVPLDEYTFRGSIGAYDAETGTERWRFYTTPGDATGGAGVGIWSTPAVDVERGVLYVGTGQNYAEPPSELSDSILAIDYRTGELVWSAQFTHPDVWSAGNPGGADADVGASPNLWSSGDRDLVGAGDKAGVYHALDRDTGEVVWETPLTPGSVFGGVQAAAAFVDGSLVVASNVGNPENNSPTNVAKVFALEASTGAVQWETSLDSGMVFAPITAVPGVAFVATTEGAMLALDGADGTVLWRHDAPNQIGGGPAIIDGRVLWGFGYTLFGPPGAGGLMAFTPDSTPDPSAEAN